MSLFHSKGFKYFKNLVIGVGASLVMLGALYKIQSWEMPIIQGLTVDLLTVGLITEAILFGFLGLLGPDKDYYWEKLYPGLDSFNANISSLSGGELPAGETSGRPLNADQVEHHLGGMLDELQSMAKSLGSLKALQEVDFTETSTQIKATHNFYSKLNDAMQSLTETVEDTMLYKDQMASLNRNLSSLNSVYGNVLSAYSVKS